MKKHFSSFAFQSIILLMICICLYSCAGVENVSDHFTGKRYGFLYGLLHGFITPISFIGSLFDKEVAIYAVNNTGWFYDLGFLLGSGGWGFLAGKGSKKKKK